MWVFEICIQEVHTCLDVTRLLSLCTQAFTTLLKTSPMSGDIGSMEESANVKKSSVLLLWSSVNVT